MTAANVNSGNVMNIFVNSVQIRLGLDSTKKKAGIRREDFLMGGSLGLKYMELSGRSAVMTD